MSDKKHELYLIAIALVFSAALVLYVTFTAPSTVIKSSSGLLRKTTQTVTLSADTRINLNTASVDELVTLKGIGEEKAAAIVSYREENGSFTSVYELINVSGIGDKLLESLLPYVTL